MCIDSKIEMMKMICPFVISFILFVIKEQHLPNKLSWLYRPGICSSFRNDILIRKLFNSFLPLLQIAV